MNIYARLTGGLGILIYLSSLGAQTEENGLCLDCHGDVDFWVEGVRSVYVSQDRYDL